MESTKKYSLFKKLNANRALKREHVTKLAREFIKKPDAQKRAPIIVNDKMEVIDGQHRLEACTRLGIPVWYIKVPGLTIIDAQEINTIKLSWNYTDFAQSYQKEGRKNYKIFLDFIEKYGTSYGATLQLLANSVAFTALGKNFRQGNLMVFNEDTAHKNAQMVREILDIFTEFGGDQHQRCIATYVISNHSNPEYSHKRMVSQLKKYGDEIVPTNKYLFFKAQMDDVYNK